MDHPSTADELRVVETDLDDATPETLGALPERLRREGAKQVSILPTTAKGSRPGHLVRAVVAADDVEAVARRLARETGSLGVRTIPATHAFVARTDQRIVELRHEGNDHEVAVKAAWMDDEVYDVSAEQGDAAAVAEAIGSTARSVAARAEAAVRDDGSGHLIHLVRRDDWTAQERSAYAPDSLDREGYVHCSTPAQVARVANATFEAADDLLALRVDPRGLSAPVRYEPVSDTHFPHVYGPLPEASILEALRVPRGESGFQRPPGL